METERMALMYESLLWRRNPFLILLLGTTFNQEYRIVSRALKLTGGERILDLACGPGIYTRRFARTVKRGSVTGIDLSWPMLKHGKRLVQEHRLSNVRLIQGNALRLPFSSSCFDVVNCAAALHLFGDLAATFTEVRRILAPWGRFTFSTFRYPRNKLIALYLHLRGNITGIRSFRQEDIEQELHKAGFPEIRYLHTWGIWVVMSATKSD
jgi:ubiquinone/menaquinone biosynthesis C-methylase UbiE